MSRTVEDAGMNAGRNRLRNSIVSAAFWTIVCSVATKGITLAGQVVLAWYLFPEDMGMAAIALSIGAIFSVISMAGVGNLLIQRHDEFDALAPHVFWLTLSVNSVLGVVLAAAAPVAAAFYGEPRLAPLLLILGLSAPLNALPIVYASKLQVELRFRSVSFINTAVGTVRTISMVVLALAGFKSYSIVLPLAWVPLVSLLLHRLSAGRVPIGWPRPRQWLPIVGSAFWLSLHPFLHGLQTQGINSLLGFTEGTRLTGLFFWALQIATQAMFLLALSLRQVFFAGFSKMRGEPDRMLGAALRAVQALLFIGVPVGLLQAFLAPFLVPLIFSDRWTDAVPAIRMLSLGTILIPLHVVGMSILTAEGRFAALSFLMAGQGALIIVLTGIGSFLGGLDSVSTWAAVGFAVAYAVAAAVGFAGLPRGILRLCRSIAPFAVLALAELLLVAAAGFWLRDSAAWKAMAGMAAAVAVPHALAAPLLGRDLIRAACGLAGRGREFGTCTKSP